MTASTSPHPVALEFTGERYVPEESGDIQLEHMHRYALAKRLAAGKRVLDLACGEGYGSMQLIETAVCVTGIDVDPRAISHARMRYRKAGLHFVAGSAASLPVSDRSFDLVVSFETIEHLHQQEEMLAEIRRVLTEDGLLLISSPNKLNYTDAAGYANPFHVKELYQEDFEYLLRRYFRHVALFGQRLAYGSVIAPSHRCDPGADYVYPMIIGEFKPLFDIAIASNGAEVTSPASFLQGEVIKSNAAVALLKRIQKLETELEKTFSSRSWRITKPLRALASFKDRLIENFRKKPSEGNRLFPSVEKLIRESNH